MSRHRSSAVLLFSPTLPPVGRGAVNDAPQRVVFATSETLVCGTEPPYCGGYNEKHRRVSRRRVSQNQKAGAFRHRPFNSGPEILFETARETPVVNLRVRISHGQQMNPPIWCVDRRARSLWGSRIIDCGLKSAIPSAMLNLRSRSIWHLVDSVATAILQSYGIANYCAITGLMASIRTKPIPLK